MPAKTKKQKTRKKLKRTLSSTLYLFVEPKNKAFATKRAKKSSIFNGNISAYVNGLISRDRGVKITETGFKHYLK